MSKSNAKGRSKNTPDDYFVQLYKTFLNEPAWLSLSMGARVLYIAVKSHYNGSNNGEIFLSVRKAAELIASNRKSCERWFGELIEKGFIQTTKGGSLGSDGKGVARYWRLTEIGYRGERPTREYLDWKKQNPVVKKGTGCRHGDDSTGGRCRHGDDRCRQKGDSLGPKTPSPCRQIVPIYNIPHSGDLSGLTDHSKNTSIPELVDCKDSERGASLKRSVAPNARAEQLLSSLKSREKQSRLFTTDRKVCGVRQ